MPRSASAGLRARVTCAKTGKIRAYCQAFIDGKWKHVLTVCPHEHAQLRSIVVKICDMLQNGEMSFDEAKSAKSDENFPKAFLSVGCCEG